MIYIESGQTLDLPVQQTFKEELEYWIKEFELNEWHVSLHKKHFDEVKEGGIDIKVTWCDEEHSIAIYFNKDLPISTATAYGAPLEIALMMLTEPFKIVTEEYEASEALQRKIKQCCSILRYKLRDILMATRWPEEQPKPKKK
jgi:hypothetical protein